MNFKKYADNLVNIWPCLCLQKALDRVVLVAASKNNHKIHNTLLFLSSPHILSIRLPYIKLYLKSGCRILTEKLRSVSRSVVVGCFGSGERKQELFLAVVGIFLSAQTQKHTHIRC